MSSEKTAIHRVGPSGPMKLIAKLLSPNDDKPIITKKTKVLDYGCGRGADVKWLRSKGIKAQGYDLHHQPKMPKGKFDVVTCFYVVNVIPTREERKTMIEDAVSKLKKGGVFVIATRLDSEINPLAKKQKWKKVNDGYQTTKGFQVGYNLVDLLVLCYEHKDLVLYGNHKKGVLVFSKK